MLSIAPNAREHILRDICTGLSEVNSKIPQMPPIENSMIVDTSPKSKELSKVLEDLNTPKEFLSATESKEMFNIND
jgi:hypothetical protein